jgi:P-type conjugative transfer protein VirB9
MNKVILASLLSLTMFIGIDANAAAKGDATKKAATEKEAVDPAAEGIGAPMQNKIWKYTYSPETIFRIYAMPGKHVNLVFGDGEGLIQEPVVGDSLQWKVDGGPYDLNIKPVRFGIDTDLTVVTNKRRYQFQLIAAADKSGRADQMVSFDYPDERNRFKMMPVRPSGSAEKSRRDEEHESDHLPKRNAEPAQATSINTGIDPGKLRFTYTITGDASFKPTNAYCDDKFTYLVMPKSQDTPAVFLVEDNDKLSIVKFKPRDDSGIIVVERVAKKLLLQLGDQKVYVSQTEPKKSWWQ